MSQSKEEEKNQRELFGALLGFQVGDRVKHFQRYQYSWREPARGYWIYGTIREIREDDYPKGDPVYRVKFAGDYYTRGCRAKDLVRCRKYERR